MPEKLEEQENIIVYAGRPFNCLEVRQPALTQEEKVLAEVLSRVISGKEQLLELRKLRIKEIDDSFAEKVRQRILKGIEAENLYNRIPSPAELDALKQSLTAFLKENALCVRHPASTAEEILENSIGYGKLTRLLEMQGIEELMVNSPEEEVFVFHEKHGMCRTNIFIGKDELNELIQRIAFSLAKKFDEESPLLDARLPDGSRINATNAFATPLGATLTIRKAGEKTLSIINLIEGNTLSSELAAYLWVFVEGMAINPLNIICAGGSSSGKTTTLDALTAFIPSNERILVIEDVMELDLHGRSNVVRMEARPGIQGSKGLSMNDLLVNALRMRPDRVIVGEVRDREARTLFTSMDIGVEGCLGTLHANNARETLLRLKSDPMNVPEQMLPLLDLIIVNKRENIQGKGVMRFVCEVAELSRMNDQVLLANLFEWDAKTSSVKRTNVPSHLVEVLADTTGNSKKTIQDEILVRKAILDFMLKSKINGFKESHAFIQQYYSEPKKVLGLIQ